MSRKGISRTEDVPEEFGLDWKVLQKWMEKEKAQLLQHLESRFQKIEQSSLREIPETPQNLEPDVRQSVELLANGINALRKIRDDRSYRAQGYQNFRELLLNYGFGERIAEKIEELL